MICKFIYKIMVVQVLLLLLAPASFGLGVEGVIFEAEAAPGQHVGHEMTVSLKENEAPMDLQVDVTDWEQSLDGSNREMSEGTSACSSAKGFLKASPSRFHLGPGESQKILVEGDVPEDVGAGGRYALISIHSLLPDAGDDSSEGMVGVAVAINSLVRLTISGSELLQTGEIVNLSVEGPSSAQSQNISLVFKNTGNYHYKALAEATLKDAEGSVLASSVSDLSSNIIPCASRIFRVSLLPEKDLLPGTYRIAVAVKQEDGGILATEEKKISVFGQ